MTNENKKLLEKIETLEQERCDRDRTIVALSREVKDVNNALSKVLAQVGETELGLSNYYLNEMAVELRGAADELTVHNPTYAAILHMHVEQTLEYLKNN